MLAIAINYLDGCARASTYTSMGKAPEWPPHPDRVFMAMVAAWGQTGRDHGEEQALRWLERQAPPEIAAGQHCPRQTSAANYVPVNDDTPRKERYKLLPQSRSKQPRNFAAAALENPIAQLIWRHAEPGDYLPPLQEICSKITNVGHSSSLVQAWVEENPPPPDWIPRANPGGDQMRIPYAGRLDDLLAAYAGGRRPEARRWQGYAPAAGEPAAPPHPQTVFHRQLIVFEAAGQGLDLHAANKLAEAFRNLIMRQCPEPLPEWISGHTPDGGPSQRPRIALLPLPFVDRPHADGRIMGIAIAIPREIEPAETARCLRQLLRHDDNGEPQAHSLFPGQWNRATLRRPEAAPTRYNLNPNTWTRPSATWHTVTPATLDRYYKGPDKARLERENIMEQCQRIGLPRPAAVILGQRSMLEGVPPAREFPRLTRRSDQGGNGEWQHTHAALIFAEPVPGPIIIGSGRYRGYGLCRPAPE